MHKILACHVDVIGLIGVGKTTFSDAAMSLVGKEAVKEDVNDPMLEAFYQDPKTYAGPLQIHLAECRRERHEIAKRQRRWEDSCVYQDRAFIRLLIKCGMIGPDFELRYNAELDRLFSNGAEKPDFIIYLKASPQTCFRNIVARSRGIESGVTLEYLQGLQEEYDALIPEIAQKGVPVIEVDWSEFKDTAETLKKIAAAYERVVAQNLLHATVH
jgi:deoxyguanosine kinase